MHLSAADEAIQDGCRELLELFDIRLELGGQDRSVVVLEVNDVRASRAGHYPSSELPDPFAWRERVDEVRAAAVRNGDEGRKTPGVELHRDLVRVKCAVAGEVAMADQQDVRDRPAARRRRRPPRDPTPR